MKGLSLFSNVGIAETYLHEVGVDIVVANELLVERAEFYKHLYPECHMITGDITNPSVFNEVIRESKAQNVDFILATPPCQGMSIAGKTKWGNEGENTEDARNYLITYVIEAIRQLSPKYVMLENVFMQLQTYINFDGNRYLIPDLIDALLGCEYYIEKKVIDTKYYGVPQQRKRAIIILSKKSICQRWEFPEYDKEIVTLEKAIGDLPSLDPLVKEPEYRCMFPEFEKKRKLGYEVSKWHQPRMHVWRNIEVMMHTPTGQSARKNPVYYPKKANGEMVGGAPRTYMRMDWSKAAPTITMFNHTISSFQNVHPGRQLDNDLYSDPRVLTIFEMLRVMSLPDNWDIPSWANEGLIRKVIGEGIPPLAVKRIVGAIPELA